MHRLDAIYARQSIEKKDSISIASQIELCRRTADADAVIYQDAGYSGKNTQRPAFSRLMQDVQAGKIKRVLCYRLDRISRSVYDFSLLWKLFDANNVEFSSITEAFDTNSPMGRAMVILIMTFAQLERETIVSRYTANRYARSNSGIWAGGKAPYGFCIARQSINGTRQSVLQPIPAQLQTVLWMFSEYAAGICSLSSLAKSLDVKDPTRHWNAQTVRRMLRNPVYVRADIDVYAFYYANAVIANAMQDFDGVHGCYLTVQGGQSNRQGTHTLSIARHEGIVPSALFLSVQELLRQNKQNKNGVCGSFTWLTGLLRCAACGGRVTAFRSKRNVYFQCYRRFHVAGSCTAVIHGNAAEYEAYAAAAIQSKIDHILRGGIAETPDERIHALKMQLTENERQTANIIDAIKSSGAAALRTVQAELQRLELEHEQLTAALSRTPAHRHAATGLLIRFAALDDTGKRDIARMLIDHIAVGGARPMQIIWKF